MQEAHKQLDKRTLQLAAASPSSSSSSSSPSSSGSFSPVHSNPAVVLKVGACFAFSFESGMEMGQLEVLKDKNGAAMIEDVLLLDDAKTLGVGVVCSWFS